MPKKSEKQKPEKIPKSPRSGTLLIQKLPIFLFAIRPRWALGEEAKMAILPLELPIVAGVGLLGIGAIILGIFIIGWLKKVLVNSVFGLIALFVINYLAELLKMDALKISINLVSVLVTAVLGLAGVGLLIILKLLGITVQ